MTEAIKHRKQAHRLKNLAEYRARDRANGIRFAERKRVATLLWQKLNPGRAQANIAAYRAAKIQAMPAWANSEIIKDIYELAATVTILTSIEHNVDHVVPLRSKFVCGLHCEGNLQVITALKNRRKSNSEWPDMWDAA